MRIDASQTIADAWERRRVAMSLQIERAGLSLLRERGLDDVTVEQISAAADISPRTFFRYFRNVRDVLTAVPTRESRRICDLLMARPPEESLLEALHAVFHSGGATIDPAAEHADLELETMSLWSAIVRTSPDEVRAHSHATSVLEAELSEVVRARLPDDPDEEAVGVVSAAVAAVIWFVYVRQVTGDQQESLAVHLDRAFGVLASLQQHR